MDSSTDANKQERRPRWWILGILVFTVCAAIWLNSLDGILTQASAGALMLLLAIFLIANRRIPHSSDTLNLIAYPIERPRWAGLEASFEFNNGLVNLLLVFTILDKRGSAVVFILGLAVYYVGQAVFGKKGSYGIWSFTKTSMDLYFDGIQFRRVLLRDVGEVQQFDDRIEFKRRLEPVISIPQAAFPTEEAKQQIFDWILDSRKSKEIVKKARA